MKVSELMAILAKCDPEAEVVMPDGLPIVNAVEFEDGSVVLSDDYGSHELQHNGRYWE